MFVCCSVENQFRTILFKDGIDPFSISHRPDQNLQVHVRIFCKEFILYVVGIVFINVQNNQKSRIVQCHLPADLTSDGSSAPCDQHGLALDIIHDLIHLEVDRLSSEQVLNLDFPEHGYTDFIVDQLIDSRENQDFTGCILADIQQFFLGFSGYRRNRNDNLFDSIFFSIIGNHFFLSDDRYSLKICSQFGGIIVNNTGNLSIQMLAVIHLTHDHITGRSGTYNHRLDGRSFSFFPVFVHRDPQEPIGESAYDRQKRKQQQVKERITSRNLTPHKFHPGGLRHR